MEPLRKPFQGIINILQFNRHFYVFAGVAILLLILLNYLLPHTWHIFIIIIIFLIGSTTVISLTVSLYVYDLSGLYDLNWLNGLEVTSGSKMVNINAGFDETSFLLQKKFPHADVLVCDFYDSLKHTEISIKRARKTYLPFKGTVQIDTSAILLPDNYSDCVFLIFSAHEIRNEEERDNFFKELKRILKPGGKIILVEHLRDMANFMAYNIGFFHFISDSSWRKTIQSAGLSITGEEKFTPFITKFIFEKDGD